MQQEFQKHVYTKSQTNEQELTFKVILKFWKKESIHASVTLKLSECNSPDNFINSIKNLFEIKSSYCLEEIWILQELKPWENYVQWIKDCHGRIKFEISDSYKEYLIKKSGETGDKSFEDPHYTTE
ncbi:MAG: hypothetical protein SNJ71_02705 [Bacteroidales bacterium]